MTVEQAGLAADRRAVIERLRAAGCVFAEEEAHLILAATADQAERERLIEGRIAGLPLEQLLGWAEFAGLRIALEPGVFVPRRRTELLVTLAVRALSQGLPRPAAHSATRREADTDVPTLLDLCCGSGAIAAAIAARTPIPIEVYAGDDDPTAVRCATANLASCHGHVARGDLYAAVPTQLRGVLDLIVCCPPYVPTGSISLLPAEAREHEPLLALDGGADGLDVARRVVAGAPDWLRSGGLVLIETSDEQAPRLLGSMAAAGLSARRVDDEEIGAVAVVGTRP